MMAIITTKKLRLLAFTVSLAASQVMAEEAGFCGTPDEIPGALAKSADIPKVAKVYSGKLKAIIIRIGFSDAPYATDSSTINKTNATVNTLFRSMSRNAFEWDWRTHDKVLSAPGTKAEYAANFAGLQSWIASQITAAGLKRGTDYDVYIANFPQLNLAWAGLSNLRDGNWINGSYSASVTGHELGHSLGLPHAHSVEAGADMFGTPGTNSQTNEYGNPFDIMGRGGSTGHFNVLYKWRVGWGDADEIREIKTSGTYRIHAQDNALHKGRIVGLRVPSGNADYGYWFEYRTISTSARNGVSVMFQGFRTAANLDSWYLDTTPGSRSSSDESDGVLAVGKEFQDRYGAATFKTMAINSGIWNEEGWVDLQVTIPGSETSLLAAPGRSIRLFRESGVPAYNVLGRAIRDLSPVQTLAVKPENGKPRLELNAR